MFRTCVHKDIADSLETIGAAFAIFESKPQRPSNPSLVSANSRFEEITQKPVIDCIGVSLMELYPRYVEKQMHVCFNLCLVTQEPQETEVLIEVDGISHWWRFLVSPIIVDDHGNQRMIFTMIDITEKKALERELETVRQRYKGLVETSYDGIITIDHNQMITMINEAAMDMFDVAGETVVGDNLERFIPQRFRDKHPQYIESFRKSAINVRPMQLRSTFFVTHISKANEILSYRHDLSVQDLAKVGKTHLNLRVTMCLGSYGHSKKRKSLRFSARPVKEPRSRFSCRMKSPA